MICEGSLLHSSLSFAFLPQSFRLIPFRTSSTSYSPPLLRLPDMLLRSTAFGIMSCINPALVIRYLPFMSCLLIQDIEVVFTLFICYPFSPTLLLYFITPLSFASESHHRHKLFTGAVYGKYVPFY